MSNRRVSAWKYNPQLQLRSRPCCWMWPGNFVGTNRLSPQCARSWKPHTGFDPALWDEMVALGWAGIALPESCGGSGLGIAALVPVVEAMGRAMLGTPLISSALAGQLLLRAANSEQVERLLPAHRGRCAGHPGPAG